MQTSQHNDKQTNNKSKYFSVYGILLGAFFGAVTGASMMAWWLMGSLQDAPEISAYSSYFADAKTASLYCALLFGAALLVVLACEIFSAKKAPKTNLASA
ncbi:hypothetical protein L4Z64_001336 [Pseudomonas aeruginosa]|nr:hypothetical protein [Pseudomonas aeruginosa]